MCFREIRATIEDLIEFIAKGHRRLVLSPRDASEIFFTIISQRETVRQHWPPQRLSARLLLMREIISGPPSKSVIDTVSIEFQVTRPVIRFTVLSMVLSSPVKGAGRLQVLSRTGTVPCSYLADRKSVV